MNIDKMLGKIIGKTKGKPKGASNKKQSIWKSMSIKQKTNARRKLKDSDGDRVPNKFDCRPRNVMRQDSPNQDEYYDIDDPRYKDAVHVNTRMDKYGKVYDISGKKVGMGIAASGIIVPVILPAPVMAGVGAVVAKNVDKVRLIKTDEHDVPYKIPRVEVYGKKKQKLRW